MRQKTQSMQCIAEAF